LLGLNRKKNKEEQTKTNSFFHIDLI